MFPFSLACEGRRNARVLEKELSTLGRSGHARALSTSASAPVRSLRFARRNPFSDASATATSKQGRRTGCRSVRRRQWLTRRAAARSRVSISEPHWSCTIAKVEHRCAVSCQIPRLSGHRMDVRRGGSRRATGCHPTTLPQVRHIFAFCFTGLLTDA